ncbi:hypothetical protein [Thalassotalea crassostreae]|uniref:hypothetical protein n=1 Tax=Thalassotalea crassostreae TaxID=1763536 RepID=UPI000838FC5B|nr:hypothetical protein [Thalassotalea crassostreae]
MSFFKKLFSKEEQKPIRQLNQVQDLLVNDIIVFDDSFALPEELRAEQFQVTAINTYEYEFNRICEWVLATNTNIQLYLCLDIDDEISLKLSRKISEQDVEAIFDLDEFSDVFEEGSQTILTTKDTGHPLSSWFNEQYRQDTFAKVGYFHRTDHRQNKPSQYEGEGAGEPFELYSLTGQDDQYSIDVEVWEDGHTDVFLNLYRPTTDIKDYYPGS